MLGMTAFWYFVCQAERYPPRRACRPTGSGEVSRSHLAPERMQMRFAERTSTRRGDARRCVRRLVVPMLRAIRVEVRRAAGECATRRCALLAGENAMARVKRGTKRRARRKKYLSRTKGIFPHKEQALPIRAGSRQSRRPLRLSRPPRAQAPVPHAVDPAHRRGRAAQRPFLQPVDARAEDCAASRSIARCWPTSR